VMSSDKKGQPETYIRNVYSYVPRASYDKGKRAAEALFFGYQEMHNVDIWIARTFDMHGPRMRMGEWCRVSSLAL
jgi:UDP-glucuronate decarboxylase